MAGFLVDADDFADDGGVSAEALLPEGVREEENGGRRWIGFAIGVEDAAEQGAGAEFAEVVGGDKGGGEGLGVVFKLLAGDAQGAHDGGEGVGMVAIEGHGGVGDGVGGGIGGAALEAHERSGVADRDELQDHHVEQAEGGDIDADADGQDEDSGDGEAGGAAQGAGGVGEVLEEAVDPGPAPGFAGLFAEAGGVAEGAAGGGGVSLALLHFAVEGHLGFEFAGAPGGG